MSASATSTVTATGANEEVDDCGPQPIGKLEVRFVLGYN